MIVIYITSFLLSIYLSSKNCRYIVKNVKINEGNIDNNIFHFLFMQTASNNDIPIDNMLNLNAIVE